MATNPQPRPDRSQSPTCEKEGCPRRGRPTKYLRITSALNVDREGASEIVAYICTGSVGHTVHPGAAHYYYRGSTGQIVKHCGENGNIAEWGHYEWQEANGERREARSHIGRKPLRVMPACPQHGKRTKFVRTYHLMIVKSANRPIDITLSECDGPPHHYIHFGPNGQISKALPRVKGKKGRYELSDSTGKLIETEWIASPETRKALSVASSLGWGKKGSKKRKARGKAISRASRQPEVRAAKSAATRRMHARRKSELAELRALKAAGPVRKPGPQPDVTIGADVEELYNQGIRWSKIKEQMDNRTGVHRSADAYRMLLKRYRDLKGRTN